MIRRAHPQRPQSITQRDGGRFPTLKTNKLCGHIVQCVIKSHLCILPSTACSIIKTLWQSLHVRVKSWNQHGVLFTFDPSGGRNTLCILTQHGLRNTLTQSSSTSYICDDIRVCLTSFVAPLMLKRHPGLEQHVLICVFYQETSTNLLLEQWQAEHLRTMRLALEWPACSAERSAVCNVRYIMKPKTWQKRGHVVNQPMSLSINKRPPTTPVSVRNSSWVYPYKIRVYQLGYYIFCHRSAINYICYYGSFI